jgi:hypothetical protein
MKLEFERRFYFGITSIRRKSLGDAKGLFQEEMCEKDMIY